MTKTISSVMIVDDSIVQRRYAMMLMQHYGVTHVHEASTGSEALHLLSYFVIHPNLIIVDLEMPDMDGVQLLTALHHHYNDIPVVVLSGREPSLLHSVELMVKSLGMNVIAVIAKPFSAEKIAHTMQTWQQMASAVIVPTRNTHELKWTDEEVIAAFRSQGVVAYYQPQVSMKTGMLTGVEVLARIVHPQKGIISANRFIPVLEKHRLMHELTLCIFEQAMQQESRWRDQGLNMSISVNFSAKSLTRDGVVQKILDIQAGYATPSDHIILEITESEKVADIGATLSVLASLRLSGFGLSMDDYGTGFSSLQQLSMIPFTELKIDQSFIKGADQKPQLQIMLKTAIEMARQLHITTVAEGIETQEEWCLLKAFGCDLAQGFFISHALTAEALSVWLKSYLQRMTHAKKDS